MIQSDPFAQIGFNARRRTGGGLLAPFVWLGGLVATALAVTVGAVLAVLTAAAVAVIALIALVVMATVATWAVAAVNSRAKNVARVWQTQLSAPSVMRWSMLRKLCASWQLKPMAKR